MPSPAAIALSLAELAAATGGLLLCAVLAWTGGLAGSPAWLAVGTLVAMAAAAVAKACAWNGTAHAPATRDTSSALGLSGRADSRAGLARARSESRSES